MYKKNIEKGILSLAKFRLNMGLGLSKEKVQYIWGENTIKNLSIDVLKVLDDHSNMNGSNITQDKIGIALNNLNILLFSDWVKFIGISGSTAAGFANSMDDIDLFIVVKNGCAWIYRGIILIRNMFNHLIRTNSDKGNVKDLFCINFIVEERGLEIDDDMFNFHELVYLIPVYNPSYLENVYKKNRWLTDLYGMNRKEMNEEVQMSNNLNFFAMVLNIFAFFAQLLFMFFSGHKPEIGRLFNNYKKGRIEFFPVDFKQRILEEIK